MNVLEKRDIRQCFSVVIIPQNPQQEMNQAIAASLIVDAAVGQMLNGKITPEELLEFVEPYLSDVDQYIAEVEQNLFDIDLGDQ